MKKIDSLLWQLTASLEDRKRYIENPDPLSLALMSVDYPEALEIAAMLDEEALNRWGLEDG